MAISLVRMRASVKTYPIIVLPHVMRSIDEQYDVRVEVAALTLLNVFLNTKFGGEDIFRIS